MYKREFQYVGIDIGSMFLKLVVMDKDKNIKVEIYEPHHGKPIDLLKEKIKELKLTNPIVGATGVGAHLIGSSGIVVIDTVKATIRGVKHYFHGVKNIIDIGSGTSTLIELDEKGGFKTYQTNSLCAAGTGSFLDEQAERLGISYSESATFNHIENPPTIASRCTVFAKSDLIHRQQEGYSREEMWSGLCRGLTTTMLQTLFKGKPVTGKTILVGGVSLNKEVLYWLKRLCDAEIVETERAHVISAIGAALIAMEEGAEIASFEEALTRASLLCIGDKAKIPRKKPLLLEKTKYPDFSVQEQYIDENNTEVRIHRLPILDGKIIGYLGIDIGSTSTKAVLIDENEEVILDLYRKTLGNPIGATRFLFYALKEIEKNRGVKFDILGVGTTGSGRKLIGQIIGADAIINEITAHVAGAVKTTPDIETIFEIGGQDSKYMRVKNGNIYDSNMNYVCAAGTGSFVEEQAKKLGFNLKEVGDIVMGIAPPPTSDRCTVFMEQDVTKLIRMGFSREEVMAGVLNSVVLNYLNKVVGRRYISKDKVAFMGATARNKGLVAAFEQTLGVEIVVSPYCHVMGAYGLATLVRKVVKEKKGKTTFRGLDIMDREIKIRYENCNLCSNYCKITFAKIEGLDEEPSWGYMCGRDPEAKSMRELKEIELFKKRNNLWRTIGYVEVPKDAPTIGIPRTLATYSLLPLYMRFFGELGFKVRLSPESDQLIKEKGNSVVGADFCFPVKLFHGHVIWLAEREDVDFIFLPHVIAREHTKYKGSTDTNFCPYLQGIPGVVEGVLELNKLNPSKVLRPILDLRTPIEVQVKQLYKVLGPALNKDLAEIRKAWEKGLETLDQFERKIVELGSQKIVELEKDGKVGIVLVGRPYNIYDGCANVSMPQKIAQLGYTVIPVDMIPFEPLSITDEFKNIYWNYAHRILATIKYIRKYHNLFPVYFTNYSCGPDSFILTYAEHLNGENPMLILEFDEHDADAGYMTRVEAFLDVVKNHTAKKGYPYITYPKLDKDEVKNRRLWIPPMHPFGTPLFAAAFRRHGYDCKPLPPEDRESYELGRKVTRGMECLPTSLTIGVFLKTLREEKKREPNVKHMLFMPTAEGPCRFGQYATLQRMILNREGYEDVPILSPTSHNAYMGLSGALRQDLWRAMLIGDIMLKFVCRVRPYEKQRGMTDKVTEEQLQRMIEVFESGKDIVQALREMAKVYESIPRDDSVRKPLVGIVGEIYVRANPFSNEDVIRSIEESGGEAWLTPLSEWIMYTTYLARHNWYRDLNCQLHLRELFRGLLSDGFLIYTEHKLYKEAGFLLKDRHEPPIEDVINAGRRYIPVEFEGEAILTVGRAIIFAKQGAKMIVNASPFACMPGTLSTATFQKLQQELSVPIANMFYDGEGGLNDRIKVFLANIVSKEKPITFERMEKRSYDQIEITQKKFDLSSGYSDMV